MQQYVEPGKNQLTDRCINTTMEVQSTFVFFDASVLNQIGLAPYSAMSQRLVELVRADFISVVTTDVTKAEVVRHHTTTAFDVLKPAVEGRFRSLLSRHFHLKIPELGRQDLYARLKEDAVLRVERLFQSLEAETLSVDDVQPSVIFGDYDRGAGLFGAKNKKNQFPDAFIFERLKQFASTNAPLLLVAVDRDFRDPAEHSEDITLIDSISALFTYLGLVIEEPNPDLELFLYERLLETEDFLYWVEQQELEGSDGASINTYCEGLEIREIVPFAQSSPVAPILVRAEVAADLNVETAYDGQGVVDYESGNAKLSFYAAITVDETGIPIEVKDIRVFECGLSWGTTSIRFIF